MTSFDDNLMCSDHRPAAAMVRGEGSFLFDEDGKRYLDFVQGWAVNCLGHCPPLVQRALVEQASDLLNPSPAFHNLPQRALAGKLAELSGLERIFFGSSGAEANEGAIKLARKWGQLHRGGAHRIITTEGGFHGRTLATMAASGKAGWDALFPPAMPGFLKVPFGDVDAAAAAIDDSVVAMMLEPIQGEAGVVVPPPGYLRSLRELTRQRGILLILDEVQTGVGRTGTFFAHEADAIRPDIMTLGKGLGGGLPASALLAAREVDCFERGDQGGTFSGAPLIARVALAVVEEVSRPAFLEELRRRGDFLLGGLEELAMEVPRASVRGRGMLRALELPSLHTPTLVERAREAGLLLNAPRENLLRFMPALNVSEEEIAEALRILRELVRTA